MASLPSRRKKYLDKLIKNCPDWAEIILDENEGCLGFKRNEMLKNAKGYYVAVLDDDDEPLDNYFSDIKKGIELGVDAVCISLNRFEDGKFIQVNRFGFKNPFDGVKTGTGHFCPVKKELALKSGYRNLGNGEDHDHIKGLQPYLKTAYYVENPVINQFYEHKKKEYNKYPSLKQSTPRVLPIHEILV